MNSRKIKKILKNKFDDYLESIKDVNVRNLVKDNSIITGGAIASLLLNENVNDFDIYFTNDETVTQVCNYYIDRFYKEIGNDKGLSINDVFLEKRGDRIKICIKNGCIDITDYDNYNRKEYGKYFPVYFTPNAITLSDKIQIIVRFFGNPDEIHKNYDFEHCKCYWVSKNDELVLPQKALKSLLAKELIYTGSRYPLSSIIRTRKFIERGFKINAGQYLKMAIQLNDLDLRNIDVLKDQLIGIDVSLFNHMLSYIEKNNICIDNKIDNTKLLDIINKFF